MCVLLSSGWCPSSSVVVIVSIAITIGRLGLVCPHTVAPMLQQFIRQWFVFDCISFVFDCFSCYWPLHYPFSVYLLCFFVAVFAFKDIHFIRVQMLLYCDSECSLLNVVTMKFGRTLPLSIYKCILFTILYPVAIWQMWYDRIRYVYAVTVTNKRVCFLCVVYSFV